MPRNALSPFNASLLPPHLPSSNSSLLPNMKDCFNHRSVVLIFNWFSGTNILLLLPVCSLVIYLGVQRWRRRSGPALHCDVFTYHMVAIEVIGIAGCGLYGFGAWLAAPRLMLVGMYLLMVATNAQVPFHILTCVERYLAVVHPITYMRLRERGGVRVRNVAIGCVWLFFFALFGISSGESSFPFFCISVCALAVISFCSLSVLRVLIRPGPGEVGGVRQRVDRSKLRAFHIITAVMGCNYFLFGGNLLVLSVYDSTALSNHFRCDVLVSGVWFGLPSSLVLPLLFLHRAGKLLCCKNTNNQDTDPSRAS